MKVRLQWNGNARWWQVHFPPWGLNWNAYANAEAFCRMLNQANGY